jgi:signal transduction histidine kinase
MLVVAAMAWLSRLAFKLDSDGKAALRQAAFEENVRLALWRMDSTLSGLISMENARPYESYRALIHADPYSANALAQFYFQFDPKGRLTLPAAVKQQNGRWTELRRIVTQSALLNPIQYTTDVHTVQKIALPAAKIKEPVPRIENNPVSQIEPPTPSSPASQMQQLSNSISGSNAAAPISRANVKAQNQLNSNEANVRESIVNENIMLNFKNIGANQNARFPIPNFNTVAPPQNTLPARSQTAPPPESQNALPARLQNAPPVQFQSTQSSQPQNASTSQLPNALSSQSQNALPPQSQSSPPAHPQNTPPAQFTLPREVIQTTIQDTSLEMMNPIWLDKDLFLVRRAYIEKQEYIQGCWLDWPSIRTMLLKRIEDLLPQADLAPLQNASAAGQTRLLASIPAMLFPGPVPEEPREGWSILHVSLSIAWAGVLLATFAIAIVLRRTMELNQRRGAFVSAVTHELRTPLTTFRLYTEMLDAGMVTEDAKRKQYYSTLHSESERLSHLVENVLMYAQLENSRGGAERVETVRLADLKERIAPSLSERAMQCGMELSIEIDEPACHAAVRADISAVERILFNLVDNAGKYGRADRDPGILLSIALKGGMAALSVCDRGPGITPRLRKKLFMPFSKSASEAANSAPGVGLGLSISRGLARQMRGDLHYDFGFKDGACFILTLPISLISASRSFDYKSEPFRH